MSNHLYIYSLANISLQEALQKWGSVVSNAVGLLYSPQSCQLVKVDTNGDLSDSSNKQFNLLEQANSIFEARIFNKNAELRWLNELGGKGQAVLIAEKVLDDIPEQPEREKREILETIQQKYLLWGQKTNTALKAGWQRLAAARIGTLDIPLNETISKKQRVYLTTKEYLAEIDSYGNVDVIEELLLALEVK